MIHKPRCRHPACCLTGPGGHTRTCTATMRSGNCFRPRDGCRRRTVCAVRTYHCLLGLLAVTGLRISEARNLRTEDVDLNEGILTIRGAKFGKSRLVPIHPSTRKVLSDYASRRDRCFGPTAGGILRDPAVARGWTAPRSGARFTTLSRQIGLRGPSDSHGPRLHDFRHRFAVETLVQWYRSGQDVERRLPILSTTWGMFTWPTPTGI